MFKSKPDVVHDLIVAANSARKRSLTVMNLFEAVKRYLNIAEFELFNNINEIFKFTAVCYCAYDQVIFTASFAYVPDEKFIAGKKRLSSVKRTGPY